MYSLNIAMRRRGAAALKWTTLLAMLVGGVVGLRPSRKAAHADTRLDTTPMAKFLGVDVTDPPQGLFDVGYVRDATHTDILISPLYAIGVSSLTGAGSVDVVTEICHGGAFVDDFSLLGPAAHTFSAGARWNQRCLNWDELAVAGGGGLENFTRAWRDSNVAVAAAPPPPPPPFGFPLITLFAGASAGLAPSDTGDGAVFQDAFSAPSPYLNCPLCATSPGGVTCVANKVGNPVYCEYPQYESPDNFTPGPNDTRMLGNASGQRQFAILVQWDRPANANSTMDRFAVDILRVWTTLVQSYGVLGTRIAVLYNRPKPLSIGPVAPLPPAIDLSTGLRVPGRGDPSGVPPPVMPGGGQQSVPVDGSNSLADWTKALAGGFFLETPMPGDKLLIYNTGHGALKADVLALPLRLAGTIRYLVQIASRFAVSLSSFPELDSSITDLTPGVTASGYSDQLQLSFRSPVAAGTQLFLDGNLVGTFGVNILPLTNPLPVCAPSSQVSPSRFPVCGSSGWAPTGLSSPVAYQVTVDPALLTDPNTVTIDLMGSSSSPDPSLLGLFSVDFRGGDQELLAPQVCDFDSNGVIDINDINAIFTVRGTAADTDDPRDPDGDGLITVNDARICANSCTNANCAP